MIDLTRIRNNIKHRCLLPPEKTAELCDEIERLTTENRDRLVSLTNAIEENTRLTAAYADRWDAWWEMRDEFECGKGPFTSEQALEIMDSYETIEMDKYRKERDSSSQKS